MRNVNMIKFQTSEELQIFIRYICITDMIAIHSSKICYKILNPKRSYNNNNRAYNGNTSINTSCL